MSGAEVMGLLSATITVIDVSIKLYVAIKDTSHLPEAFQSVGTRLPLVRDTLETLKERLKSQTLGDSTKKAIHTVVESCGVRAERLRDILEEVAAQPDASRVQRYHLALRRLGKQNAVEELMIRLLEDIQLLAANQTVHLGEDQIKELVKAVQELSKVAPSVTPDGDLFQHSGIGDQYNHTGQGSMNITKGNGRQNFAHIMNFTSS